MVFIILYSNCKNIVLFQKRLRHVEVFCAPVLMYLPVNLSFKNTLHFVPILSIHQFLSINIMKYSWYYRRI